MREEIPAKIIITCDMCGDVCSGGYVSAIKLEEVHRDSSNCPVGGGTKNYDLCENCSKSLIKFIKITYREKNPDKFI